MDYAIDFYEGYGDYNREVVLPEYIYDNRRLCSKLYVFLKLLGLISYITMFTACYKPDFFIIMIIVMFLSTMNSIRYEYKHYKRYKTTFSSIDEFDKWKLELWPKSRIIFNGIELGIKIWFFIKIFPPQFEFNNLCNIGESIFKIHILVLFILYILVCILFIFILCLICCYDIFNYQQYTIRQSKNVSLPIPILIIDNQNEECSICLDMDSIQTWTILPCGHKFHGSCVSTWLLTHQTCPICRFHMISIHSNI
jgi:hypothetical protein